MIELRKVLFPTDFSELSLHALRYALSFAEQFKAELHILHVVDEAYQYWMVMGPGEMPVGPSPEEILKLSKQEMKKFVEGHLAAPPVRVVTELTAGRPYLEIIRYAKEKEIDLIVLGTHGRGGLRHALLGSVAERVVRKAPCPVLTIRNPEHEFVMP